MKTEAQALEERVAELEEKLAESQRELASARESHSFQSVMMMFLIILLMVGAFGSSTGDRFSAENRMIAGVVVLLLQLAVAIAWNVRLFMRALRDSQFSN
jgi:hypothetical protein